MHIRIRCTKNDMLREYLDDIYHDLFKDWFFKNCRESYNKCLYDFCCDESVYNIDQNEDEEKEFLIQIDYFKEYLQEKRGCYQ